jgi:hypothetical protein
VRRLPTLTVPAIALGALLLAPCPAPAEEAFQPVPLEALQGKLETAAPYTVGPGGLRLTVDGNTSVGLPFQAELLELDVEASGPVSLTWASRTAGVPFRPFGPPWRHLTLPRERRTVVLDLRITDGWNRQSRPVLGLTGAGVVTLHGLRASPVPRDSAEIVADFERAQRWAPEAPGHTTINFLTPSFWSATERVWLSDAVALMGLAAFAVAVAVAWLRRKRPVLGRALAAGCLVAAGLWNVHLLVRFLPAFHLRPTLDVEERIRDHYDVAPDVGALAALARATLRPDERVGVLGSPGNWFAPQTLCFNLAPRPCVIMTAGTPQREYVGISQVGRLRAEELDAIVAYRAAPLPEGFTPIAALGNSAIVARRRP